MKLFKMTVGAIICPLLLFGCNERIEKTNNVTSITLNPTECTIEVGETQSLQATVLPKDASDPSLTWESSNDAIVHVDEKGTIKGIATGNATITVTANSIDKSAEGPFSATCAVTVLTPADPEKNVTSVALDPTESTLNVGETLALNATVFPEDASDPSLTWTSSDESVAIVDKNGIVTAINAGKTTITAQANSIDETAEGPFSATCDITVIAPPHIGDYYYSDGSWSSDLDNGKTPIGVVFYVGDPSIDDEKLRTDHPECTHGLVMALNDTKSAWHKNYEAYGASKSVSSWLAENGYPEVGSAREANAPVNKMIGYSYTSYIEKFNEASENANWPVSAVAEVVKYREKVPAPKKTSDWYLGSGRELVLACFGKIEGDILTMRKQETKIMVQINSAMEKIEGADLLIDDSYWTSVENGVKSEAFYTETAWNVYFCSDNNSVSTSFKAWDEYARARAILAF